MEDILFVMVCAASFLGAVLYMRKERIDKSTILSLTEKEKENEAAVKEHIGDRSDLDVLNEAIERGIDEMSKPTGNKSGQ